MAISDMSPALAASDVDEALAEIECQRELIVELMHLGQPTEAAEQALNSLLGQFASRQPTEAAEQAPPVRSSGHPKAAKQETTWA